MNDQELSEIETRQKAATPPGRVIFESRIIAEDVPKLIQALRGERERCVRIVYEKLKAIADKLEAQMPGFDAPPVVEQLIKAIRGTEDCVETPSNDPKKLKMALTFLLDSLVGQELGPQAQQAIEVARALLYGPQIDPRLVKE